MIACVFTAAEGRDVGLLAEGCTTALWGSGDVHAENSDQRAYCSWSTNHDDSVKPICFHTLGSRIQNVVNEGSVSWTLSGGSPHQTASFPSENLVGMNNTEHPVMTGQY